MKSKKNLNTEGAEINIQRGASRCGECGEVVKKGYWFLTYYVKRESDRLKVVDLHLNHRGIMEESECRVYSDDIETAEFRGWKSPPVYACFLDPCVEADFDVLEMMFKWSRDAKQTFNELKRHLKNNNLFKSSGDDLVDDWLLEMWCDWLKCVEDHDKYLEKVVIGRGLCPETNIFEVSGPDLELDNRYSGIDYISTALFQVVLKRGAKYVLDAFKEERELKEFLTMLYQKELLVPAEDFLETRHEVVKIKSKVSRQV